VLEDSVVVDRIFLMPIGLKGRPALDEGDPRPQGAHFGARLQINARGCDGRVRQELAAGVTLGQQDGPSISLIN
jgi:hypothetical protein